MHTFDDVTFFYKFGPAVQCAVWNYFAEHVKEKDGVDLYFFPNDIENRADSVNEIAKRYDLEPYDMYQMGTINSEVYCNGLFMYFDAENKDIHVVESIAECVNDETLEAFFDWFHELCNAKKGE